MTAVRTILQVAVISLALFSAAGPAAGGNGNGTAPAQVVPAGSNELNSAIEKVISRPEYAWRLPRDFRGKAPEPSPFMEKLQNWLRNVWAKIDRFLRRLEEWLRNLFKTEEPKEMPEDVDWSQAVQGLMFVSLAVVCSVLGIVIYRLWKNRGRWRGIKAAEEIKTVPDITDESVRPDVLPSDEWMAMARDFLEKGELRLAIRAMFLACLACLAHRKRITIARYKSNRDYFSELCRKAHDIPAVLSAFRDNVGVLEKTWYGMHPATADMIAFFEENWRKIREGAASEPGKQDGGERSDAR